MSKEITIEEKGMAACSAYWAYLKQIRLANGQLFTTIGREYQIAWMTPPKIAKERCYMKATGAGVSDGAIIESIHGMLYGRYPQGVLYGFPTDDDMQDYSKTRWNPLIELNQLQIGQYLGQGKKRTDAAGVKRICNANLYLRGMRMQPTADGESRQSVAATGIHVDKAVLDEVDQMDIDIVGKVRGRLSNARIDGVPGKSLIEFIGNPSDEDRGIDAIWQKSDQRYWFRKCSYCNGWTCAEIEFFNDPEKCVGLFNNPDERRKSFKPLGFIRCVKCGRPVGQRDGVWVPKYRNRPDREGYNWSYLTSENQDPAHILKCYRNPPEGNIGDVIRLMLGRAYSSDEERLRKEHVWACCNKSEGMPETSTGPCAMGVDNSDHKHVTILQRTGNDRYQMIRLFEFESDTDYGRTLDLIRKFNIKTGVVDLRPNADSAKEFRKSALRLGCRVWLCEYTDSPLQDASYNDQTGIVKVYRTGMFDRTHKIIQGQNIVLPRRSKLIDQFAEECCNTVKSKEIDKRTRNIVYRYKKTGSGKDDFRNSLNYAVLAANKVPRAKNRTSGSVSTQSMDCDMSYSVV